uniref:Uncharacterized protein n=1 Tax=Onchocerca volvulus TaxID=6282 RepID=A0A8R1TIE1_ONCVO
MVTEICQRSNIVCEIVKSVKVSHFLHYYEKKKFLNLSFSTTENICKNSLIADEELHLFSKFHEFVKFQNFPSKYSSVQFQQ